MIYEPPAIYGIIGNPVQHSLSPVMHNAAFKSLEVNAVYKLFPLADADELKLFMEDLKEDNNLSMLMFSFSLSTFELFLL